MAKLYVFIAVLAAINLASAAKINEVPNDAIAKLVADVFPKKFVDQFNEAIAVIPNKEAIDNVINEVRKIAIAVENIAEPANHIIENFEAIARIAVDKVQAEFLKGGNKVAQDIILDPAAQNILKNFEIIAEQVKNIAENEIVVAVIEQVTPAAPFA